MIAGYIGLAFLVVLGALMVSISWGFRYIEAKKRKQLLAVLKAVTETESKPVEILMESEEGKDEAEELPGPKAIYDYLRKTLAESGVEWTLGRFLTTSGALLLGGLLAGAAVPIDTPIPLKAAVLGLVGGWLPLMFIKKKRTKRLDELETQLPDALDFLSRSMRAGHAFTISLEMVGEEIADPLGQEFRTLFNEQNLGAPLDRSLENFATRVPLGDVRFFSSAVLLQRQTGGNLSEILARLSHIIRERFRLKGQVKATSAHGRMTATILTLLPVGTLIGLMVFSPGYLDPLTNDPSGRKLLGAGIVCMLLGNFFIRKIVRIQV